MLGVAASDNNVDMVKTLLEHGCDPTYDGASTMMFDYGDDTYVGGVTVLHIAATEGALGNLDL